MPPSTYLASYLSSRSFAAAANFCVQKPTSVPIHRWSQKSPTDHRQFLTRILLKKLEPLVLAKIRLRGVEYFQHFFPHVFNIFKLILARMSDSVLFHSGRPTGSSNGSLDLLFAGLDASTLGQSAGSRLNESGSLRKKLRSF